MAPEIFHIITLNLYEKFFFGAKLKNNKKKKKMMNKNPNKN